MPLYEYECESCGRRFERIQKFSDPPVDTCPTCGQHVRRLVSSPAVHFKGSGWYVTDYAKKSGDGSSSSESSKKAADTSSKGTDSKPAESAKPESSSSTTSASKPDTKTTS